MNKTIKRIILVFCALFGIFIFCYAAYIFNSLSEVFYA